MKIIKNLVTTYVTLAVVDKLVRDSGYMLRAIQTGIDLSKEFDDPSEFARCVFNGSCKVTRNGKLVRIDARNSKSNKIGF